MYVIINTLHGGECPEVIFSTYRKDVAQETVLSLYEEHIFEYFNIYIQKYPTFSFEYLIDFAKTSARLDMMFINIEYVPKPIEDCWLNARTLPTRTV